MTEARNRHYGNHPRTTKEQTQLLHLRSLSLSLKQTTNPNTKPTKPTNERKEKKKEKRKEGDLYPFGKYTRITSRVGILHFNHDEPTFLEAA